MADQDINMERFAYDVCVHVLEKFGVFKPPDDMRKQNKYVGCNFLTSVSRTVLVYTALLRDKVKDVLEVFYKRGEYNNELILNIIYEEMLKKGSADALFCTGKICLFLAVSTEYLQFASTRGFEISLNKIVIGWNNFFEKNLRKDFEAEGGSANIFSFFEKSQVVGLDDMLKDFISEYLQPYGARKCTMEFIRRCPKLPVNPLRSSLLGVKDNTVFAFFANTPRDKCETGDLKGSPSDDAGIKEREQKLKDLDDKSGPTRSEVAESEMPRSAGCETNNSEMSEKRPPEISQNEDSRCNSASEVDDLEIPMNVDSETSNSEMLQNQLLGIPPHEEMLREIDPFFVENIPSPPKPEENEPVARDDLPLSPDQEELAEKVEELLSKLEHDMEALRILLSEHGLLSGKSGRRGSKVGKGKKPPKGPEGLI